MPLLTQFMHDIDNLRPQRDKNGLPAVGKLFVAQRQIHLMAKGLGKRFVSDFSPFVLMEGLTHRKALL